MDGIDANRILPDSCLEARTCHLNVRKKEAVVFSYLFYIRIHDMAIPYARDGISLCTYRAIKQIYNN